MPKITVKFNNKSLGDYQVRTGLPLTIGRRQKNDVVIEDMAVSGHHAKIESMGEGFMLIDLQSKNGSFVNEQIVNSHWLKHGDIINIGEHALVFSCADNEPAADEDQDEMERTMMIDTSKYRNMMRKSNPTRSINVVRFWDTDPPGSITEQNKPNVSRPSTASNKKETASVLNFLAGGSGEIKLTKQSTTIGKNPNSDLVVKGLLIGKMAATISKMPDGFYLCYIGGLSKPKVNQKIIKTSIILKDQDIIEIGSTKLQFLNTNSTN